MRTVPYTNFCTKVATAEGGTYTLIRFGTDVVANPIYAIMNNYTQEVLNQGRYKWVSEVLRSSYNEDVVMV